ncbi:MAG: PepSY domain-containing protein [Bacteroidales bacterium]|nr:PepSY domain-containing protein [Bacteroidales bacterium]
MHLRKLMSELHKWLGLFTGAVLFVVCTTGCIYAFKDEITDLTEPWRHIDDQSDRQIISPSELIDIASEAMNGNIPTALTFSERTDALRADYYDWGKEQTTVWVNSYNGNVLHTTTHRGSEFDFWNFILRGHTALWLPRHIGKLVVGYSVLIFFIVLITGLVVWLPKRIKIFKLKERFTLRKTLVSLHAVLGLYAIVPLIALCITGMLFALSWFSTGVYFAISGGKSMQPYTLPHSQQTHESVTPIATRLDILHTQLTYEEPQAVQFYYALPADSTACIRVSIVHKRGSYYRTDNRFFDQYSLTELNGSGPWAGKYNEASTADTIMRANLELHDGRMFGIVGKIIMFFASFVGAWLAVSGYVLWIRRLRHRNARHLRIVEI